MAKPSKTYPNIVPWTEQGIPRPIAQALALWIRENELGFGHVYTTQRLRAMVNLAIDDYERMENDNAH